MSEPYLCKLVYDSPEPQNNRSVVKKKNDGKRTMHCFPNSLREQRSHTTTESTAGGKDRFYDYIHIHKYMK